MPLAFTQEDYLVFIKKNGVPRLGLSAALLEYLLYNMSLDGINE